MYCPECNAEYRPGFTECADCLIPLVSEPPPSEEEPRFVELEEVLSTANIGEVALIKSLLDAEKIPYVAQGEHFNAIRAPIPVRFPVPREELKRTRELLKDFL